MAGGFKEIKITNFSSQQKEQRFPSLDEHYEPFGSPDFDEDPQHSDDQDGQPPRIAEWRSNLVSLSQRYNLYFAAYQDKIHVSIPGGLKQTLQGSADLIIELPVSEQAIRVGGYIDDLRPHCVNHMIVGDFGTHEILLMCCDDGDVLAYYTHVIWNAVKSMSKTGNGAQAITQLFHENVGISAWGLAVHQKSRLIAVSSNLRQVTVFVPAYAMDKDEPQGLPSNSFLELSGANSSSPATRRNNFRRVLKLGPEGHNIPSIDFASGIDGEAKSILAVDIQGKLWILDIWNDEKLLIPTIHKRESRHDGQMGWGVLSIPLNAFKQTATPQEALGMLDIHEAFAVDELGQSMETFFNVEVLKAEPVVPHTTSALILEIDNDDNMGSFDASELSVNGDDPRNLVVEEESGIENRTAIEEEGEVHVLSVIRDGRRLFSTDEAGTLLSSKYVPDSFKRALVSNQSIAAACFRYIINMPVCVADTIKSLDDLAKLLAQHMELDAKGAQLPVVNPQTGDEEQPLYLLPDRSAILRTYQFDIELIPASQNIPKSLLREVVKRRLPPNLGILGPFDRLCFIKSIPELSLVVIGSQAGRVALITLTCPQLCSPNGPALNFRLECILPRKQEEDKGLRPNLPLFGMAVGPLQAAKEESRKRRWRILLHYYDHTVLSYELSRDEEAAMEVL